MCRRRAVQCCSVKLEYHRKHYAQGGFDAQLKNTSNTIRKFILQLYSLILMPLDN